MFICCNTVHYYSFAIGKKWITKSNVDSTVISFIYLVAYFTQYTGKSHSHLHVYVELPTYGWRGSRYTVILMMARHNHANAKDLLAFHPLAGNIIMLDNVDGNPVNPFQWYTNINPNEERRASLLVQQSPEISTYNSNI